MTEIYLDKTKLKAYRNGKPIKNNVSFNYIFECGHEDKCVIVQIQNKKFPFPFFCRECNSKKCYELNLILFEKDGRPYYKDSGKYVSSNQFYYKDCVRCGTPKKTYWKAEKKHIHPNCCQSCSIKIEWSNGDYKIIHKKALKKGHNRKEAKLKHAAASVKNWQNPELRAQMSNGLKLSHTPARHAKQRKTYIKNALNGKHKKITPKKGYKLVAYHRPDGSKIMMRSSYETRFASVMDRLNISWLYENKTYLIRELSSTYTPDFYLPSLELTIEVKGYWWNDAKLKWNHFCIEYDTIKKAVVMKKHLIALEKGDCDFESYLKEECRS